MQVPQISVIMPVRNGDKYLAETIDGILAQTFSDFELVAVDGGSTDRTLEILSAYKDPRIRVIEAPGTGIVAARNIALENSRGTWVACNDADDVSLPRRFELQMAALKRTPNAVLSYTNVRFIGQKSPAVGHAHLPRTQAFFVMKLCFQFPVVHSTVIYRKESALKAGGFEGKICEDYRLVGKLAAVGNVAGVSQKLLKFRISSGSASDRDRTANRIEAEQIGKGNLQTFMRLTPEEAKRAYTVLQEPQRRGKFREWMWFLRYCVPRLPSRSAELNTWLAWQTLKRMV